MKANFNLKTPKENLSSIVLSCTYKIHTPRLRYELKFPNDPNNEVIKIPSALWDKKKNTPKNPTLKNHIQYTASIEVLRMVINQAKTYIDEIKVFTKLNNIELSEGYIINELDKKFNVQSKNKSLINYIQIQKKLSLLELWVTVTNNMKEGNLLKSDSTMYNSKTITSYNQTYTIIKWFDYEREETTYIDNINQDWYDEIMKFFVNEQEIFDNNADLLFSKDDLQPSTIGDKHIKNIKFVLGYAFNRNLTSNAEYNKKYFIRPRNKLESHAIALSEKELENLYNLNLTDKEDIVRDLFLIATYTALRYSDFSVLQNHNFKKTDDDYEYIEKGTIKTKAPVKIPILWNLKSILLKYNYNLPTINSQYFNEIIKTVGEKAGITEIVEYWIIKGGKELLISEPRFKLMASHTGRRTAATNLIRNKIPVEMVMEITGHKKYDEFKKYIKLSAEENVKDVTNIFNNNKNANK